MKVIILAGGYGTRLTRDIKQDPCQRYHHLLGLPKPLMPIAGQCVISRWMRILKDLRDGSGVNDVYLVTNHHFVEQFRSSAADWPEVSILDDGTSTNENRLGAIADLNRCLDTFHIEDDVLVIGGDTLFYEDFDLDTLVREFYARKCSYPDAALVTCYKCPDTDTTKFGILEINEDNRVVAFLEKPDSKSTESRWACPCFYVLSTQASQLIPKFLEEHKDAPLQEKDATGHFIKYLQARKPVFVVPLSSGRFDIGSLQSYIDCDNYYTDIERTSRDRRSSYGAAE